MGSTKVPVRSPGNRGYDEVTMATTCRRAGAGGSVTVARIHPQGGDLIRDEADEEDQDTEDGQQHRGVVTREYRTIVQSA